MKLIARALLESAGGLALHSSIRCLRLDCLRVWVLDGVWSNELAVHGCSVDGCNNFPKSGGCWFKSANFT